MAAKTGVTGIDHDSWQVTVLTLPKGYSRGSVYGFCGGNAVGHAEAARSGSFGCWWPSGKPELLRIDGKKYVASATATGEVIPGHWREESSELRAVAWSLRNGVMTSRVLHTNAFEQTWATASGGGLVVGIGAPHSEGTRRRKVGVVWRDGHEPMTVVAEGEVALFATDGQRLAGSVHGRATLWPAPDAAAIDLTPASMQMAEIRALDGDTQVGTATTKRFRFRAGIWKGSAESFVDLTPSGFETSGASGAKGGYQVGSVRRKENTRGGSAGSDNCAVLWQGAADRWFDLHALLPAAKFNASRALAIHIEGDLLQVGGEASQYELTHAGTAHEGHAVPVARPVIWTARLNRA